MLSAWLYVADWTYAYHYFDRFRIPQWSKKDAHRLLQTRTRTLDGTLRDLFTTWYPAMPANDVQPTSLAAAA